MLMARLGPKSVLGGANGERKSDVTMRQSLSEAPYRCHGEPSSPAEIVMAGNVAMTISTR